MIKINKEKKLKVKKEIDRKLEIDETINELEFKTKNKAQITAFVNKEVDPEAPMQDQIEGLKDFIIRLFMMKAK